MKRKALAIMLTTLLLLSIVPSTTALAAPPAPTDVSITSTRFGPVINVKLAKGMEFESSVVFEIYDSAGNFIYSESKFYYPDDASDNAMTQSLYVQRLTQRIKKSGTYTIKVCVMDPYEEEYVYYKKNLTVNVTVDSTPVAISKVTKDYTDDSMYFTLTGQFSKDAIYDVRHGFEHTESGDIDGWHYYNMVSETAGTRIVTTVPNYYDIPQYITVQKYTNISVTSTTAVKLTMTLPQKTPVALQDADSALPARKDTPTGTASVGSFTLKMRDFPSSNALEVIALKNGAKLEYFEKSGAWVRVITSSGVDGWVAASYLCFSPYTMKTGDTAKVFSGTLKLRKEASSSSAELKILKNGNTVKILDNTTSKTWVKVDAGGTVGWVAASYIGKGI